MKKPRKISAEGRGLFGEPLPPAVVKAPPPAPADQPPANRIPAEPTAVEYIAAWHATIPEIVDALKADAAQARWSLEDDVRARLGVELHDARILKAGLDGRCNRIRAGIIPPGVS